MWLEIENRYGERLSANIYNDYYKIEIDNFSLEYDKKYSLAGYSNYMSLGTQKRIKQRKGSIKFNISEMSDIAYNYIMNSLSSFIDNNNPYYLVDTENSKRTEISFESITDTLIEGVQKRVSVISIGFVLMKSFWESTIETTEAFSFVVSGVPITITLPDFIKESPIVLDVTSLGNNNTMFTLELENGSDRYGLVCSEIGFNSGSTISCDMENGQFTLLPDNVSINQSIIKGEPFALYRGSNILTYTSVGAVSANITVTYRIRTSF